MTFIKLFREDGLKSLLFFYALNQNMVKYREFQKISK